MQACTVPGFTREVVNSSQAEGREVGRQSREVKVRNQFFLLRRYKEFFERSRGELAARVFEKQAGLELQREERREEVVKSKRKALEVRKKIDVRRKNKLR